MVYNCMVIFWIILKLLKQKIYYHFLTAFEIHFLTNEKKNKLSKFQLK